MVFKIKEFWSGIKEGQRIYSEEIVAIINLFLLGFLYFFGIGLTSIFAKVFRKSFLDLKKNEDARTYWKELNLTNKPIKEYYRQF